jgi:hypothetical protein
MKRILIKFITFYQKTVSPDHGIFRHPVGHCRFYPSCSEYSKQAIGKYGAVKGIFLATKRILRCNPWSKGGVDEVR